MSIKSIIENTIEKYIGIISQKYNIPKRNLLDIWEGQSKKPVQAHGFSWEKELLINVYCLTEQETRNIKYNSKIDLPCEFNRLDKCDVSIKTTCNPNTVCMADCLRLFDTVNSIKPIHLTVVQYNQKSVNIKRISSIIEVDLTNSCNLLFGTLLRSQIKQLDDIVKSIPQKRKPTREEHLKMYSLRDELQKYSGAIYFNIKCNSTQSRLQCSFNRFQDFIKNNSLRVISKSDTNEFRGGIISSEIKSCQRVFKDKKIL